jgi:hypothetical protein
MLNTAFYPLRTVAGHAVPIASTEKGAPDISVLRQSKDAELLHLDYGFKARPFLLSALDDPAYKAFFPSYFRGTNQTIPGAGVVAVPPPPDLPFLGGDSSVSLMALSDNTSQAAAASLEVLLRIRLERKALVGGIVYGGHPFIPAVIRNSGESVSNFGLPREWRLTPSGTSTDNFTSAPNGAFLDSETSVSRQELLSHSGVQFLCCDPTYTDTIVLALSNWPQFFQKIHTSAIEPVEDRLRYGFLVPYLYVFEYREGTRYRPSVPAGLLAARGTAMMTSLSSEIGEDVEFILKHDGQYFPFTPASLTNGPRKYTIPADANFPRASFDECFISAPLMKDKQTTLYLEQAQEFARCLSGVRALAFAIPGSEVTDDLADPGNALRQILPAFHADSQAAAPLSPQRLSDLHISTQVRVRVWEIDPPEGIAPTQVDLGSKYTLLLADNEPATPAEALQRYTRGIVFRRPTSARYLAVEFTNCSTDGARLVVPHFSLVQSAHVAVSARPSRFQQIRSLSFRLAGDTLGEDLSRIGDGGFQFAVEHWAAGERKSVLFRATSLFDLIHAGVGRLQVNARRRAAEYETSAYGPDIDKKMGDNRQNFDDRTSKSLSYGWHRSEMGNQLGWNGDADIGPEQNANAAGKADFVSVSNQETRTHLRYLYPDASQATWTAAALFANLIAGVFRPGDLAAGTNPVIPTYNAGAHQGKQELVTGFERAWAGLTNNELKNLQVTGTTSVVQSPYSLTAIAGDQVQDFVDAVSGGVQIVADAMNGTFDPAAVATTLIDAGNVSGFAALLAAMLVPVPPLGGVLQSVVGGALALNGLTINLSATAAGLGATFGSAPGNLLPVVTQSATAGNQGTVTKQATQSNFSYSQSLATGGDNSRGTVYPIEGLMKRELARAEVPDNQSRVRGAEVMWQGRVTDVVSGAIPLNILLPALATKGAFRTSDESIRVRLGSGVGTGITVDFWFDVTEEMLRDDY